MTRTLVGAIGYRNLRDHSAAFEVVDRLSGVLPEGEAVIEDTSYNPIALVQWLDSLEGQDRFDRAILVAAVTRPGRTGGAVDPYHWDGRLPSDELVQQAVTEAVTGIINLDNTLTIAGYFKALPAEVIVVEIEPIDHAFGSDFSSPVRRAIEQACSLIQELATDHARAAAFPRRALEVVETLEGRAV